MFGLFYLIPSDPILIDYIVPKILVGDAIVCWRACVLWKGNQSFMGTCIILLLTTFGTTPDIVIIFSISRLTDLEFEWS